MFYGSTHLSLIHTGSKRREICSRPLPDGIDCLINGSVRTNCFVLCFSIVQQYFRIAVKYIIPAIVVTASWVFIIKSLLGIIGCITDIITAVVDLILRRINFVATGIDNFS